MRTLWIVLSVVALLVLVVALINLIRAGIAMYFFDRKEGWVIKLILWLVVFAILVTMIVLVSYFGIAKQVG